MAETPRPYPRGRTTLLDAASVLTFFRVNLSEPLEDLPRTSRLAFEIPTLFCNPSVLQRFDKYTIQTLGFALIVLGIFLFMAGLIGGPQWSTPPVPLPWYWWVGTASFFSGIALVVIGIILLFLARGTKPKQKTGAAITPTS